jgi:hypothetical protein
MSYDAQNTAVRNAILAFAAEIKTKLDATAAEAAYAQDSAKLEGLTLNEVVELIAGTTGLTIQDVQNSLDAHIARTDNPHAVTAEQVGLGLVDNFATATEGEAAGTSFDYIVTDGQTAFTGLDIDGEDLELVDGAIVYVEKNAGRVADADFTADVGTNTVTLSNPTAAATYSYTATDGQSDFTGAADTGGALAIASGQKVAVTVNGSAAPHTVNVSTNTVTLDAPAAAGDTVEIVVSDRVSIRVVTTDRFMTPTVLWHVLDVFWAGKVNGAPETLDTIQELSDALDNNPDVIDNLTQMIGAKATQADIDATVAALTKADIGLGDVENFGVATNQEAIDGTAVDKYMTPAATKAATDAISATLQSNIDGKATQADIDAAIGALTKASVGLDKVDNFATATNAEALAGTATNLFMTPATNKHVRDDIEAGVAASLTALESAFNDALSNLQVPAE